ncbi:hypothetical protein M2323_002598 [Rhodoblastus acidophilus]|uniref:bifunctional DNA primase/polymerase n=1 Tax=Rhodoblastus acidophilus TaxID=1074 RepID=UPI002224DE5B|nr:bifunctional DNA primase/polymerase [Rhodoblastus acidophilus]MCW2284711.1 hypothetical protein [Rhodoblastus acidophilus]MCW2333664.1 hypothetical protein [Rhodoblastus acidophilus]
MTGDLQKLLDALPGARLIGCPPMTKGPRSAKWQMNSSRDPAAIMPGENVGVHIGGELVVIDVEGPGKANEKARAGLENLAQAEERLGALPPTLETLTPSGGRHLIYMVPAVRAFQPKAKLLHMEGVELRTGDQIVMAPPSRVRNAAGDVVAYRFAEGHAPGEIAVAELPAAWVDAILKDGTPKPSTPRADDAGPKEKRLVPFAPIRAGCAFVDWVWGEGAAVASEPEWYAALSFLPCCEGGRGLAHELGKVHPGYSAAETDAKFDHAADFPPRRCDYIAGELGFAGCQRCPLRGTINSPIALGFTKEHLARVQRGVVYIAETRQYFELSTRRRWGHAEYADWIKHQVGRGPHDQLTLSKTTGRVTRADFIAGDDRLIVETPEGHAVNLWQRDGVTPVGGDASPILGFIDYLIPDPASRSHILDYLAHLLQRRGVKIMHGLIVTGGFGSGKSTLGRIISALFGRNARTIQGEKLASRWNTELVDCEVLIAEEAAHGEKFEVSERIKDLVTRDWFQVEQKHVATFEGRTPRGILVNSNHEAALVVAQGDRRWMVVETVAREAVASPDFFRDLNAKLNDGETLPAFAHWLMQRDLAKFNPNVDPPITEAKRVAIAASRTPLAQVIAEGIESEELPFHKDIVTVDEVVTYLSRSRWTVAGVSPEKVAGALRSLGAVRLGQIRLAGGGRTRPWVIRNRENWRPDDTEGLRAELSSFPAHLPNVYALPSPISPVVAEAARP